MNARVTVIPLYENKACYPNFHDHNLHVIEFMQNETYCREQEISMLVRAHFVTEANVNRILWFTISQNSMNLNQKQGYCTLNKIHK